jgi:zinc transporter 9
MSTLTIQEPHIPKFPTDLDLPPFLLPLLTNFHKMAFIRLIVLSTIMFVSTFFIGLIPLSFSLSSAKLRAISTFGIGLLVGAALTVIIPEGVESVYKAAREIEESSEGEGGGHDHGAVEGQSKYVGLALLFGFMLM